MLENTLIQAFGTGITCATGAQLSLNQTSIFNCRMALEMEDAVAIQISSSKIINNHNYGIYLKTKVENLFTNDEKRKIVPDLIEMQKLIP